MLTSVRWLNRYLDPADLTPDEAVRVLEATSFPIEDREDRPDGDAVLDVEVTSNRGDCVSHVGLAREIAAATGRRLTLPEPSPATGAGGAGDRAALENRVPELCPRFTARVITGVRIGPSPSWLVEALESIGQRSINNVVDVSNFVLFELGHPSHTFDLATLRGGRLVVRHAETGERLVALDGAELALRPEDLVVADAERPVSLAGVIGGLESGVTERTTDVLLEVATWDPATIRRTARRLGVRTDAGYRFERTVDARELDHASLRCAELILEVAGGTLAPGSLDEGRAPEARTVATLRAARCEHVLGKALDVAEMTTLLEAAGFGVRAAGSGADAVLECAVPHFRPDVTREIDVIEEVARLHGIDQFDVAPSMSVPLEIDHPAQWAGRDRALDAIGETLSGAGFYETVTFSFLPEQQALPWLPAGMRPLKVDEARRKDAPFLRPSVVPSLLTCRRANQDAQVSPEGGVRLFEIASVFADEDAPGRATRETRNLALCVDAGTKHDDRQRGLRTLRGAIDAIVQRLTGEEAALETEPVPAGLAPAYDAGEFVGLRRSGRRLGLMGLLGAKTVAPWGLDQTVAVAEIGLDELIALGAPSGADHGLPQFPAIERDVSLVLDESARWAGVESLLSGLDLERLEGVAFVGTFRGAQVGAGKKSVTLRLTFRDAARTLRHDEVDPEVERFVRAAQDGLGATLRA